MGFFDNFPYTDFHELNLDWILSRLGLLNKSVEAAAQSATEAKASETAAAGSASSADEAAQRAENAASSIAVNGRRFVLIGDSYLEGVIPGGLVNGWGYWFKQYAGLADNACYIFGEGRSGFCAIGSEGHTFSQLLSAKASEVTDPDGITDVFFIGGYNDRSFSIEEITAAIDAAAPLAQSLFPNAHIKCGFVGRNVSETNTAPASLYVAGQAYRNTYSMGYLSGIELACRDLDYFSSDGIHPTETGYRVIGRALFDLVFTGSVRAPGVMRTLTGLLVSSVTQLGNVLTVFFDTKKDFTVNQLDGQTLNGSTVYDMGLIDSGAMVTAIYNVEFTVPGFVLTEDGTWRSAVFTFGVNTARHLTMRCTCTAAAGSWATAKATDAKIVLMENTVTLPALFF